MDKTLSILHNERLQPRWITMDFYPDSCKMTIKKTRNNSAKDDYIIYYPFIQAAFSGEKDF